MPWPSSKLVRRFSMKERSLRWTSKSSGTRSSCSLSARSVSSGSVVRGSRLIVRSSSCSPVSGGAPIERLSSSWASATAWYAAGAIDSASSALTVPSACSFSA